MRCGSDKGDVVLSDSNTAVMAYGDEGGVEWR